MPTYGYARVWARLRRKALTEGRAPANRKRVYRVMKVNGLLLERHAGGVERRHDGRIAVERSNLRWCSDGFEIGCDNGEKVRVAFALDCCGREATWPCRHHRGHQGRRCLRPHGHRRRAPLRQGQPPAADHRMADR